MNLKRIEAYGFKSFADKLVLDFDSGVTCIVGPNGCGKSNISDAIRWVLGEQSPKNLRGKNMQEVIFNGTANRRSMGYCEVSLVFDNSSRTYSIDCDELTITRKLYRTGDSEYYINKEKARLKDILDLFRDTGIGKDGYSVVGQGKIDSLLSAKPEDRRQIFEEAAGINKFKVKRLDAMRRLERSLENLKVLKGTMESYEKRLEPLKKQAEIALKARFLRERLKIAEANHYIYLTEHNAEEKAAISEKLNKVIAEISNATIDKQKTERDYGDVKARQETQERLYSSLTAKRLDLSVAFADKRGQNNTLSVKLEALNKSIEAAEVFIKESLAAIEAHTKSKESSNLELQTTMRDFCNEKAKEEEKNKECDSLFEAVKRQKQEKDITNDMLYKSMGVWGTKNADLSRIEAEMRALRESIASLEETLQVEKKELKEEEKKLSEAEKSIEAYTEDKRQRIQQKKQINELYGEKLTALQETEDSRNEMRDQLTKLSSTLENLVNNKNQNQGYDYAVKFLLSRNEESIKSRIMGVVGKVISVSPQFSLAIETALGGNMNCIITRNHQDLNYLIDFLTMNDGGKGSFTPIDSMNPRLLENAYMDALDEDDCYGLASDLIKCDRQFRPVIETFLGRVVVVKDKNAAYKMIKKYNNAFRVVTLDGAHYAQTGVVSGGKNRSEVHYLSLEREILDIQKSIASKKEAYELLNNEYIEMSKELKELENNSRVLTEMIANFDKRIATDEQSKQFIVAAIAKHDGEILRLNESISKNNAKLTENTIRYKATESEVNSTTNEKLDTNDILNELGRKIKEKEDEYNTAKEESTRLMMSVKTLENKINEIERSIKFSNATVERLTDEIRNRDSVLCSERAERDRIAKEIEKIAAENSNSEELDEIIKKIEEMDKEKVTLGLRENELFKLMNATAEKLQSISDKKGRLEQQLENIDKEIQNVSETIKESYGLNSDEIFSMRQETYDDVKGVQEAKILRKDILALGDVNDMAVEDLEVLSADYNEKKSHYDDLIVAINDTNQIISSLTKEMEKNFAESFEKIKKNFSEVFTELFDGGRGILDLDMEEGMSILDAGIKIDAEPPGKKLQNIDLLSGGERAMTAISIIFAIIKLHPMPFCVLDEVDAPLDDTNANIYAKYLKKFSKNTQFIIVSHRKPTMELADQLYGITMQEKGISKHLTVKLSEALRMAE